MKILIFTISLLINSLSIIAQSTFDIALTEISSDLANKLIEKDKKKVVVLYITDINKSTTVAGKYLADFISVNIVINPGNFQVFDRENLSGIVEANKLISEGYIDVDKAKELGKLLSVDAIIIGSYTVLSNTIKLTLKALDSSTGFVITAAMKDLPLDKDAGALLGISASSNNGVNTNNTNLGFNNKPLNSNENYNNPETVSKDCTSKNIGDYCFTNATKNKLRVDVYGKGNISLNSGQTQCLYNLNASDYKYYIYYLGTDDSYHEYMEGYIVIEKCKSKTFTIN